jgi:hypothetical protein
MKVWLKRSALVLGLLLVLVVSMFWLVVRGWRREFEQEVAALKAAGVPVHSSMLAPPPVPEEENAAPLLAKAATLLEGLEDPPGNDWVDLSAEEGLDEKNLREYVTRRRAILDKVAEALARPQCRFPVDYGRGCQIDNPRTRDLMRFAGILNARAVLELRAGDSAAAARDLRLMIRLSECLAIEPLLISQLVRLVILERAFDVLKKDRLDLSPAEWRELGRLFEAPTFREVLAAAFEMERAVAIESCRTCYFRGKLPAEGREPSDMGWMSGLLMIKSGPHCLRMIGRVIALIRQPYAESRPAELQLTREHQQSTRWNELLSRLILPAFLRIHGREAGAETNQRMAAAFCRIKADGRIPESLEVVDPCTGKLLIYLKESGGFQLRSPGPDQKDDGGEKDDIILGTRRK